MAPVIVDELAPALARLRVGDWRVIMLDGEVLDILDIGPRGSIY